MEDVWQKVAADFADMPDLAEAIRFSIRLILAAALGGLLGYERERAGKAAGLRTHMLVSLGAALFVLIPQQAGMSNADISRIVQGVVAGVGFLGAGAIVKGTRGEDIHGLTTAAGIWLTAAIGIAAGLGRESSAILGAVLAFLILSTLAWVSHRMKKVQPPEQLDVGGDIFGGDQRIRRKRPERKA
ncbi:MAG: MgtC/SapB family protein [Pirellulaceae bacterium]|nr:MgtC/SapB family protein [Pirellulaceae bacterium]